MERKTKSTTMNKEQQDKEKEEQELADKIAPLIKEIRILEEKRGNGVTLKKNDYIGDRLRGLEAEVSKLKSKKSNNE